MFIMVGLGIRIAFLSRAIAREEWMELRLCTSNEVGRSPALHRHSFPTIQRTADVIVLET